MKNFHIIAVLTSLSISTDDHLQGKELFKRFDANGDGLVSKSAAQPFNWW